VRFDPNTGRYPSFLIYFYSGSPNFIVFQDFRMALFDVEDEGLV